MQKSPPGLAELHWRFDGPIEEGMRQAALTGRAGSADCILSSASRDLDRLALSTVVARARRRAAARRFDADRLDCSEPGTTLKAALLWYRGLGVRTIEAREAAVHRGPRSGYVA